MFAKLRRSKIVKNTSGATAVEFAIVAPLFIALTFGIGQFAYAQHCASSLHFALRTVARSLMLNPALTEEDLEVEVQDIVSGLAVSDVDLTLSVTGVGKGRIAQITGRYEVVIPIPLMDRFPVAYETTVTTAMPS